MRKKLCLCIALFALCLSLAVSPEKSFAAEQRVTVTLPEFAVQLNGQTIENQYREYPLLVYKDITYFPMTWNDSRLLGLETEWTQSEGLNIVKRPVTSSYRPDPTNQPHPRSLWATIPAFQITINGKSVDNSKEEYPLLMFNNVTYFPLTWKFAHDEFGWTYVWNNSEGLAIHSDNPPLKTVNLPAFAGENDVALFNGYYYFTETVGNKNQVYRVLKNDTSNQELVYSYDLDTAYGLNKHLNFEIRDNELWFFYHRGGAIMGSDVYGKVNDDGKAAIEHSGYLDFKSTADGTLVINQSVPPGGNNLILIPTGQEMKNGKPVGNPNLIYGWHIIHNETGSGFGPDKSTTVIGDDVYVLASAYPVEHNQNLNKIYKINLKTNEAVPIINSEVSYFKIINNKLYYVKDADHSLYASNMDGTNEQKWSDHDVANWFDEIDGHVYYTVAIAEGQFNLYRADPSKEDTLVFEESLESVQRVKDQIICKLAAGEAHGVKVLAVRLEGFDAKALREAVDRLKQQLGDSVILLAGTDAGKAALVAGVNGSAMGRVKAGELLSHVAGQIGGKGGGRPDLAQGGGEDGPALALALEGIKTWVAQRLAA